MSPCFPLRSSRCQVNTSPIDKRSCICSIANKVSIKNKLRQYPFAIHPLDGSHCVQLEHVPNRSLCLRIKLKTLAARLQPLGKLTAVLSHFKKSARGSVILSRRPSSTTFILCLAEQLDYSPMVDTTEYRTNSDKQNISWLMFLLAINLWFF